MLKHDIDVQIWTNLFVNNIASVYFTNNYLSAVDFIHGHSIYFFLIRKLLQLIFL